jgi:hypothetical protein
MLSQFVRAGKAGVLGAHGLAGASARSVVFKTSLAPFTLEILTLFFSA